MIAQVVGNGDSRKLYQRKPDAFTVGCNFARDIDVDVTCVIDRIVIDKMSNCKHDAPPLLTQKSFVMRLRNYNSEGWKNTVYDTFDRLKGSQYSAGHHAVFYVVDKGYTTVELYGFDSFAEETVDSDTHKIWNNSFVPGRWREWRNAWVNYFNTKPDVSFVINTLNDVTIELPENVRYEKA